MKILMSRKVAWIILIICIAVSIVGMGGGSLAAQRRDVLRVFNDGIDDSLAVRFSMDAYLENCAEYARTMAEEYRLHVGAEDAVVGSVLEPASLVGDGEDLNQRYTNYKSLCDAVERMYTEFHAASVPEDDRSLFSWAYTNFQGEVSKIEYDEYHVLAEKFNRELEGFPAGAVSALIGVKPLNPF